jgi:hypothetical protein
VHRVRLVACGKELLARPQANRARALGQRCPQCGFEPGEQRDVCEEVRRGLGARNPCAVEGERPPLRRRCRVRLRRLVRQSQHGACGVAQGGFRFALDALDEQATEPGQDQAHRCEGPRVVEGGRGVQWRRRADDGDHDGHAERGPHLPGDRVHAGRGGKALAGRRCDRRRAQVGEQRARTDAEQHDPGQPLAEEVGCRADALHEPEHGAAPDEAAGDEHRPVADPLHQPARGTGDGGGDERARRERQAGLEHRVVPDACEEQDVGEGVAEEARRTDHGHRVAGRERPDPQEREVDERRAVPGAAPYEHGSDHDRSGERSDHSGSAPSPLLALDDAEDERRDRDGEHQGARQVRHPPPAGRAALHEMPARKQHRHEPDREVDQEHQPPVAGRDQEAAERRPEARCTGRDRREVRHAVRAVLDGDGLQDERQRGRDQQRRTERLHHTEGDQRRRRRRDGAQQ